MPTPAKPGAGRSRVATASPSPTAGGSATSSRRGSAAASPPPPPQPPASHGTRTARAATAAPLTDVAENVYAPPPLFPPTTPLASRHLSQHLPAAPSGVHLSLLEDESGDTLRRPSRLYTAPLATSAALAEALSVATGQRPAAAAAPSAVDLDFQRQKELKKARLAAAAGSAPNAGLSPVIAPSPAPASYQFELVASAGYQAPGHGPSRAKPSSRASASPLRGVIREERAGALDDGSDGSAAAAGDDDEEAGLHVENLGDAHASGFFGVVPISRLTVGALRDGSEDDSDDDVRTLASYDTNADAPSLDGMRPESHAGSNSSSPRSTSTPEPMAALDGAHAPKALPQTSYSSRAALGAAPGASLFHPRAAATAAAAAVAGSAVAAAPSRRLPHAAATAAPQRRGASARQAAPEPEETRLLVSRMHRERERVADDDEEAARKVASEQPAATEVPWRYPQSWIHLEFRDAALEQSFVRGYDVGTFFVYRSWALVFLLFHLITFLARDISAFSRIVLLQTIGIARVPSVVLALISIGMTLHAPLFAPGRIKVQVFLAVNLILQGVFLLLVTATTLDNGLESDSVAFPNTVLACVIVGYTAFRLRLLWAAVTGWTLQLLVNIGFIIAVGNGWWALTWRTLAFNIPFFAFNALGMMTGYQIEKTERLNFLEMRQYVRESALARFEQERGEFLLLNILPPRIVARLKVQPTIAERFPSVTVMFLRVENLSELTARFATAQLQVQFMNDIFEVCDRRADDFGITKVKTNNNCYMAVCGAPVPRDDHALAIVDFALTVLGDYQDMNEQRRKLGLRVRIGVHSGPVVAGVIGQQKFCWDVWGDTVNTASRMEYPKGPDAAASAAAERAGVGRVRISSQTAELIADSHVIEEAGSLLVKGKGAVPTYFVTGRIARVEEPPATASSAGLAAVASDHADASGVHGDDVGGGRGSGGASAADSGIAFDRVATQLGGGGGVGVGGSGADDGTRTLDLGASLAAFASFSNLPAVSSDSAILDGGVATPEAAGTPMRSNAASPAPGGAVSRLKIRRRSVGATLFATKQELEREMRKAMASGAGAPHSAHTSMHGSQSAMALSGLSLGSPFFGSAPGSAAASMAGAPGAGAAPLVPRHRSYSLYMKERSLKNLQRHRQRSRLTPPVLATNEEEQQLRLDAPQWRSLRPEQRNEFRDVRFARNLRVSPSLRESLLLATCVYMVMGLMLPLLASNLPRQVYFAHYAMVIPWMVMHGLFSHSPLYTRRVSNVLSLLTVLLMTAVASFVQRKIEHDPVGGAAFYAPLPIAYGLFLAFTVFALPYDWMLGTALASVLYLAIETSLGYNTSREDVYFWLWAMGLVVFAVAVAFAVERLALVQWHFTRTALRDKRHIENRRAEADRLLRNIVPAAFIPAIESLNREALASVAQMLPSVSVLYADIAGFTAVAEKMLPSKLVNLLNSYFSAFDSLARELRIEKVKSLGDAWVGCGGLPGSGAHHVNDLVTLALRMQDAMHDINSRRTTTHRMHLRIGIHVGAVLAAIIGRTPFPFQFDCFGHSMELAEKMEATGVIDRVHISDDTRQALFRADDDFEFEAAADFIVGDDAASAVAGASAAAGSGGAGSDPIARRVMKTWFVRSRHTRHADPGPVSLHDNVSEAGVRLDAAMHQRRMR